MIHTLAVSGYRSLRNLVLPLGQLNLVTGANGTGKSSLYRALRLLGDAALNTVVASLAREGGLPSTLWAGPETIARSVRKGEFPVEGTPRQRTIGLKLGFAGDPYSYCIDLGYPPPAQTAFPLDPAIKRECIWHGDIYRRLGLVDRNNRLVQLAPGKSAKHEEPVILTKELSSTDSMLATIADPQRAPEMVSGGSRFADGVSTRDFGPIPPRRFGLRRWAPSRRLEPQGTDLPVALNDSCLAIGRRCIGRSRMLFLEAMSRLTSRVDDSKCGCASMGFCGRFQLRSFRMARCAICCGRRLC